MDQIVLNPIGIIKSPYKEPKDIPIQGCFGNPVEACCILNNEYVTGLKDLEHFSHIILIYHFHLARKYKLNDYPFLENEKHGIFAIRSPHRPNKLGLSVVKVNHIKENKIFFTEVDVLNDTPLLDIKPYVEPFDARVNTKSGWIEKHFKEGKIPSATILK